MSSEVPFERQQDGGNVKIFQKWKNPALAIGAIFLLCGGLMLKKHNAIRNYSKYTSMSYVGSVAVGAYYYPWYDDNFHDDGYLRNLLDPAQYPTLGEYNSQDSDIISQHLAWSRKANINLWVCSWWGEGGSTDTTVLSYILPHSELQDMQIAIFYETEGLTETFTSIENVQSHMQYLESNYFGHDNYLRINGRPVLYLYAIGAFFMYNSELAYEFVSLIRESISEDVYIIADVASAHPLDVLLSGASMDTIKNSMSALDAITGYDAYGSILSTPYAGTERINYYFDGQKQWKTLARSVGTAFQPVATPGFNDKGVRDGHAAMSRKLTSSSDFGSLFQAMLVKAVKLVDANAGRILMINSFNEWHEDTQIEPVAASDPTSEDSSGCGAYSDGLEYEGYDEKYLDILYKATK